MTNHKPPRIIRNGVILPNELEEELERKTTYKYMGVYDRYYQVIDNIKEDEFLGKYEVQEYFNGKGNKIDYNMHYQGSRFYTANWENITSPITTTF